MDEMEPFDFVKNMPSDEEMDERVRWYHDNAKVVMDGANPKACLDITRKIIKFGHLEYNKYQTIRVQNAIEKNLVAKQYYDYLCDAMLHDVAGSQLSYENMYHKAYDFLDYVSYDYPRIKG